MSYHYFQPSICMLVISQGYRCTHYRRLGRSDTAIDSIIIVLVSVAEYVYQAKLSKTNDRIDGV